MTTSESRREQCYKEVN